MKILKKNIDEIKEAYIKCSDLFDEAFYINTCCSDGLPFMKKVTTYMPDVMQTLSAIIAELEQQNESLMRYFNYE